MPTTFVPPTITTRQTKHHSNKYNHHKNDYDNPTKEVNWERDFNKVNFTRRYSISEQYKNPNETDATKYAAMHEYPVNRKHRNINRNNVSRGNLPDFVQLIEDLKGDQSQLLSIRVSMIFSRFEIDLLDRPILPEAICLFMETFIRANCSNIHTLCLCCKMI